VRTKIPVLAWSALGFLTVGVAVCVAFDVLAHHDTLINVGFPDIELSRFQSWPTARTFDGPGTLLHLQDGELIYDGALPVKAFRAGAETLPVVTRTWDTGVLSQFIGGGLGKFGLVSGLKVNVSFEAGDAERYRVDPEAVRSSIRQRAETLRQGEYVVMEGIAVTRLHLHVEASQSMRGTAETVTSSTGEAHVTATRAGDGSLSIDARYDTPRYILFRKSDIRSLRGLNSSEWLLVDDDQELEWSRESIPRGQQEQ
jgi:hypothetical protein